MKRNVHSKPKYDNIIGDMLSQSFGAETACFGDEACQRARELDFQRQELELQLLQQRTANYGQGGISNKLIIYMSLGVVALIGVVVLIKFKGRR